MSMLSVPFCMVVAAAEWWGCNGMKRAVQLTGTMTVTFVQAGERHPFFLPASRLMDVDEQPLMNNR
jgi:hypothetical protein